MQAREPIRLVLMADYLADPVWTRTAEGKGGVMVPLDRLPIHPRMKEQLRAWAARFDALMDTDYEWQSQDEADRWVADGRALHDSLSAELGPDYDVEYFEGKGE